MSLLVGPGRGSGAESLWGQLWELRVQRKPRAETQAGLEGRQVLAVLGDGAMFE